MKNWIERYLYQIEKKLPAKNKKDLIEEIRSNLYDELEATAGSQPTEKDILAFLKENGSPQEIASAYRGREECLICGELYPIYRLVVTIAVLASMLGITIAMLVSIGFGTQSALSALGGFLGGAFQAAIGAVGVVTIIFILIQRFINPDEIKKEINDWNPNELPALPEKKYQLKRSEPIVAIVFLTLLIIGFNFFWESIAWAYNTNSDFVAVPMLNPSIFPKFLPWLNLVWGSALIFNIVLLIKNQWNALLRIGKIVLDWAGLGLLLWIVSTPNLFLFDGSFLQTTGMDLYTLFRSMAKIGLVFLIALLVFETGKNIYKIVKK